jgi:hypothetical protein
MSWFRAYLQLVRLPAVFTAMADIFLGYLLTHSDLAPLGDFLLLLSSSSCLYLSGMTFNDVFDREIDLQERPSRPIPSGRVRVRSAAGLGAVLMVAGLACAAFVGTPSVVDALTSNVSDEVVRYDSLLIAAMLAGCVLAYDGGLKRTPLGPLAMGACRFLNVMLGASAGLVVWGSPQVYVAAALGVYIVGVTWFARSEAGRSRRGELLAAAGLIHLGWFGLALVVLTSKGAIPPPAPLMLLGVVLLSIDRRIVPALRDPSPQLVQSAVRTMLLSLVTLDAAMVYFQTGNAAYALGMAALLIPAMLVGRWLYVT